MISNFSKTIFVALGYIFICFDQQTKAQQCLPDGASAMLESSNPDFPNFFAASEHACDTVSCRPSACPGVFSSFCKPNGVALCANASFCSSANTPIEFSTTFVSNNCTKDQFYYGEYVNNNFNFTFNMPLLSFRNNWPNPQGTYEGYGTVQMGSVSKLYNFYHKMPIRAKKDLEVECNNRTASVFLDNGVIGSHQFPNFGSDIPPTVPTCTGHTSCPTMNCDSLGSQCCFHGTCICTLDNSICENVGNVLTTSSTFACNEMHAEEFYYGEFISTLPVGNDNFFVSSLKPLSLDGTWEYIGLGTIDMSTNDKHFRKDFVFYHKFNFPLQVLVIH